MYSMVRNRRPSAFADIEDAAHARMRDLPGRADFSMEIARGQPAGSSDSLRGRNFSATGRFSVRSSGAIHLTHAAFAEQRRDAVASGDGSARREDDVLRGVRLFGTAAGFRRRAGRTVSVSLSR